MINDNGNVAPANKREGRGQNQKQRKGKMWWISQQEEMANVLNRQPPPNPLPTLESNALFFSYFFTVHQFSAINVVTPFGPAQDIGPLFHLPPKSKH